MKSFLLPLLPQDEQNVKAELGEEKAQPSSSSTPQEAAVDPPVPDRGLNRRIAVLTTLAAVGLFGSQRLQLGGFSLKDLAANAVPYEEVSASCPLAPRSFVLSPTLNREMSDAKCSAKCQQQKEVSLPFCVYMKLVQCDLPDMCHLATRFDAYNCTN